MIPNLSWGADFADLVSYLVENRDHEVLDLVAVSSVDMAAHEMESVAALNSRAKRKLLHMSLSAAIEDGTLSGKQWMHSVSRLEKRLGLVGHQRVVVRHRDKSHDHVHIFWCTININTGQTPPKSWFLRKGCGVEGIGPRALTAAQCALIPVEHRALRSYDFNALKRSQHECRMLEADLGLRQLRTPAQSAEARLRGEVAVPISAARKQQERTGVIPLIDRASEIRDALDAHDWPSKQRALAALRLAIEPVFRETKRGRETRGVTIVDRDDRANRLKASALNTPTRQYGWRQLEARHSGGAPSLEVWWSQSGETAETGALERSEPLPDLKASYDLMSQRHAILETQKSQARKALRVRQSAELRRKRAALQRQRKQEARALPPSLRRNFYKYFSRSVRAKELEALAQAHRIEAMELTRARKPTWLQYVENCARAGNAEATKILSSRKPAQSRATAFCEPVQIVEVVGHAQAAPSIVLPITTEIPTQTEEVSAEALLHAYRNGKGRGR